MLLKTVRLYAYEAGQCDVKRCTARKLIRLGVVTPLRRLKEIPKSTLLLSPLSDKALSQEDKNARSITVFDCSWRRIDEFSAFLRRRNARALPFLLAANPTNFGKPFMLSSAEALAAALFILGHVERARAIMSKFKWGDTFFKLNEHMLEAYRRAKSSAEVVMAQERFMYDFGFMAAKRRRDR